MNVALIGGHASLLREIQSAATDSSVSIADLLRKCKILATRLKFKTFESWVDAELNGYTERKDVPDYRRLPTALRGNFVNMRWKISAAQIPLSSLPSKMREPFSIHSCKWGVRQYEELLKSESSTFRVHAPLELAAFLSGTVYEHMNCVEVWQENSRFQIAEMLDTIRSRILSFVLEIDAVAPMAGEAMSDEKPIPDEKLQPIFHTHINGSPANISIGGQDFSQQLSIQSNNVNELRGALQRLLVPAEDIDEIADIVSEERPSGRDSLGPRASRWLGKMLAKAWDGTWEVSKDVAGTVLAKALQQYYGLPS